MRSAALVAMLAVGFGAGCHYGPQPLPRWAIHVDPPRIDKQVKVGSSMKGLIQELQSPRLTKGHTAAEQIAVLAIREIRNRNPLDAMLLLSFASYRYHQQALYALDRADAAAQIHLRNRPQQAYDAYLDLVRAEFETFNGLDFDREIDLAFNVWQEKQGVFDKIEKGMAEIVAGGPLYAQEAGDKLFAEIEEARLAEWDDLARPRFAAAFLNRLQQDIGEKEHTGFAEYYLGVIPLARYQQAALNNASRPFFAPTCRELVARYAAYRELIVGALSASRPETRANAGIILGLRRADEDLPLLEQAYVAETDPLVRLALAFSLIHFGKAEYRPLLVQAAGDCGDEDRCDLAMQLLQWLPLEEKVKIDQDLLVKVYENTGRSDWSRLFAIVILSDIGQEHPLEPRAVKALVAATRHENEEVSNWAARGIAWMKQLSRETVLSELNKAGSDRQALMLRLAVVAEKADVPFFRKRAAVIGRVQQLEREAIIFGLTRIHDDAAEQVLIDIFKRHPDYRMDVVMALIEHRLPKAEFAKLAALDDGVAGLMIDLIGQRPGAVETARKLLGSKDPQQRYVTTHLVRMAGKTSLSSELWRLAGYSDSRFYPGDAHVRHGALMALLEFELRRAVGAPMSLLDSAQSASPNRPPE